MGTIQDGAFAFLDSGCRDSSGGLVSTLEVGRGSEPHAGQAAVVIPPLSK